jgi:hypothetical protein
MVVQTAKGWTLSYAEFSAELESLEDLCRELRKIRTL